MKKKNAVYNICHNTRFSYSAPVAESIMILTMESLEDEYQQKKIL